MTTNPTRAGMVAVAGRPNVGKSTLVNALVGEKVSIVTPKPQTTRHRIIGIVTQNQVQIALVDTPGMHAKSTSALNRAMNETALASLTGIDLILFVVEAGRWQGDDERALGRIRRAGAPVALVVNKTDRLDNKNRVLPFIQQVTSEHEFTFVVPLSARRRHNLDALRVEMASRMPEGPFLFPEDEYTDRNLRFLIAETVREKLMLHLQQELPYSIAIEIESFATEDDQTVVHACIWVARENHKAIVIGRGGQMLKKVGRSARLELVRRLDLRLDLRLWVKVRANWIDDESSVRGFGY
ncbi:MAG TPA: GTPase Era [Salinisphaeraceae bacterium]|nr:GTPase Era [Salinisphaeraceae bacterium]